MDTPLDDQADTPGRSESVGAGRGQILILFAIFLVGMMGILGLATDVGMAYAQRRTMQNAADAGALAGAHIVAHSSTSPGAADGVVQQMLDGNRMNTEPELVTCQYVDYGNNDQGSCASNVPAGARGVRVAVQEVHSTFFIRVIPGAPETVTVTAESIAHVQRLGRFSSPFLICGSAAADVTGDPTQSIKKATSYEFIDMSGGTFSVKEEADGRTFRVHDPQISQNGGGETGEAAGCEAVSAKFNGLNDDVANADKPAQGWFNYLNGTKAGPTREKVNGVDGCAAGVDADDLDGCIMILPIMVDSPVEDGAHSGQVYVVGFAAFEISRVSANEHNATLIRNYVVSGPGSNDWCQTCGGVTVIKLTG